ncbi:MAG: CrcB family protein [Bacteroidota bacterium]|nr:CrcB family protein [Bacteroidota bacterium]
MLLNIFWVFLGSAVGGVFRYLLSTIVLVPNYNQINTLIINIIGCFLAGLLFAAFNQGQLSEKIRLIALIGFCGSFTTFSTLSLELVNLLQVKAMMLAIFYLFLSISLGLLASASAIAVYNRYY